MVPHFLGRGNNCFYMGINDTDIGGMRHGNNGQMALRKRYLAAVDSIVERVREDANVLAVIVNGSLAYEAIWQNSGIGMTVVVRDRLLQHRDHCILEDGITIHIRVTVRSEFKQMLERSGGEAFSQTDLARGKIVYAADERLIPYFERMKRMGEDDKALSALFLASELAALLHQCRKWLYSREDYLYTQYDLLKAAEPLSHMELILRGIPFSGESIQKAQALNPRLLERFYLNPMSRLWSREGLLEAMEALDGYLELAMDIWKKPVLACLADGEIKTLTLIGAYFHVRGPSLMDALEYLTAKAVIGKAAQAIKLTPKSSRTMEEIGYFYRGDAG
jgi:uncharacterized protein